MPIEDILETNVMFINFRGLRIAMRNQLYLLKRQRSVLQEVLGPASFSKTSYITT
jgi:hypothetical protein